MKRHDVSNHGPDTRYPAHERNVILWLDSEELWTEGYWDAVFQKWCVEGLSRSRIVGVVAWSDPTEPESAEPVAQPVKKTAICPETDTLCSTCPTLGIPCEAAAQDDRAAFEAWLNPGRHAGNLSPWIEPGRYEKETHQLAWLAWKSALASRPVPPPTVTQESIFDELYEMGQHLTDALARIKELEDELSSMKRNNEMLLKHMDKLGAERDALKVDAERYRWLRDESREMPDGQRELYAVAHRLPLTEDSNESLFDGALDAAIDAAMNQPKEGQ